MKPKTLIFLFLISFSTVSVFAQNQNDSLQKFKEYKSLEEALKNPESVYRLNLSNQNLTIPKDVWLKFPNLEFLSLKDDHLKEIPEEISLLKNLRTINQLT